MSADGRFFFTPTAVTRFQSSCRLPTYEAALDRLVELAETTRGKVPRELENGCLEFRTGAPERVYLTVAPALDASSLPQVVDVRPGNAQAGKRPRPSRATGAPMGRPPLPPDAPQADGNPKLQVRIPRELWDLAQALGGNGWARDVLMRELEKVRAAARK